MEAGAPRKPQRLNDSAPSAATSENEEELRWSLAFVIFVVLADEVPAGPAVVGQRRGRRRGLAEEREAEGGGRGALLARGAAVGALPGADGLQHAALPFFQHVFLWRRDRNTETNLVTVTHI